MIINALGLYKGNGKLIYEKIEIELPRDQEGSIEVDKFLGNLNEKLKCRSRRIMAENNRGMLSEAAGGFCQDIADLF